MGREPRVIYFHSKHQYRTITFLECYFFRLSVGNPCQVNESILVRSSAFELGLMSHRFGNLVARAMGEKLSLTVLFKVVYGFHVVLTVVSLLGTVYLAYVLRQTQTELLDFKKSLSSRVVNGEPESETGSRMPTENKPHGSAEKYFAQKLTEVESQEKTRRRRSVTVAANKTCAELIRMLMDVLSTSNRQVNHEEIQRMYDRLQSSFKYNWFNYWTFFFSWYGNI